MVSIAVKGRRKKKRKEEKRSGEKGREEKILREYTGILKRPRK